MLKVISSGCFDGEFVSIAIWESSNSKISTTIDEKKNAKQVRLNEQELSLGTIEQSYLIVSEKEIFR